MQGHGGGGSRTVARRVEDGGPGGSDELQALPMVLMSAFLLGLAGLWLVVYLSQG